MAAVMGRDRRIKFEGVSHTSLERVGARHDGGLTLISPGWARNRIWDVMVVEARWEGAGVGKCRRSSVARADKIPGRSTRAGAASYQAR